MERNFRCVKSPLKRLAATMDLDIMSLSRDDGIKSVPPSKSKDRQEINLTSKREVATLTPPNDLKHQQSLMDKIFSLSKCWKTSCDGSVVKSHDLR
jgi:hypothetical protein